MPACSNCGNQLENSEQECVLCSQEVEVSKEPAAPETVSAVEDFSMYLQKSEVTEESVSATEGNSFPPSYAPPVDNAQTYPGATPAPPGPMPLPPTGFYPAAGGAEQAPQYGYPVGPGYGYPAAPGYGYPQAPAPGSSGKAIAILVMGIAALVFILTCGFGLVPGIVALCLAPGAKREIARSQGMKTGYGMIKAGVICSWIAIGLAVAYAVVMLVLFIAGSASSSGM